MSTKSRTAARIASLFEGNSPAITSLSISSSCCLGNLKVIRSIVVGFESDAKLTLVCFLEVQEAAFCQTFVSCLSDITLYYVIKLALLFSIKLKKTVSYYNLQIKQTPN